MTEPARSEPRRTSASARSLLLTVLGEFALPRQQPVWTATILAALSQLGVEPSASRQALSRTSSEGLVASARHGRRTTWSLTERGQALLTEGTARIYGFLRHQHDWDGRWLVLSVAIPERQRQLRHRLRTQLTWLGLGSPTSGLWVSPNSDKAEALARVISDLDLDDQAIAWVGPTTGIGDVPDLVAAAWDLARVEREYLNFIADFDSAPGTDGGAFTAQIRLVQAWRHFPFLDPDLPRELLAHDWPGHRAAALFHDRHALWHRQAQQAWDQLQAEAAERT